ncbi:hypothetical protein O9929_23150 [Vibrio lentus]|nr:hypothetical protein [Vibrio lentus]
MDCNFLPYFEDKEEKGPRDSMLCFSAKRFELKRYVGMTSRSHSQLWTVTS